MAFSFPVLSLPAGLPEGLLAQWETADGPQGNDAQRAQAALDIMYYISDRSRWQAVSLGEAAVAYAQRSGDQTLTIRALLSHANNLGGVGQVPKAFEYVAKAMLLARALPPELPGLLTETLLTRASLRSILGNEHGALRDLLYVLREARAQDDAITVLLAHINMVPL